MRALATNTLALCLLAACHTPSKNEEATGERGAGTAWPVVYRQDFQREQALDDFAFSDANAWRWHHEGQEHGMLLRGGSKYRPPHRSPTSIALLKDLEVADFDLEVDLKQTGRNYGHRDLCLFFGFQSRQNYYYTHMATSPDQNAHNVFRVDDAPRTNVAPVAANGIDWGDDVWHRIRVERRVEPGTIKVYWDDQEEPILTAEDRTFDWGRIGFGSFDDSGIVANIVVRAPAARAVTGASDPFREGQAAPRAR